MNTGRIWVWINIKYINKFSASDYFRYVALALALIFNLHLKS